jgi:prepilin-type N-terminal cleavage/methylation domain-containing protein
MKSIKKAKIKSLCKRYAKSKSGTTLVELVCVVTILGIVSSAGIGGMFGMVKVARAGQNVSVAERSCALLTDQLSIYGNTSYNVKSVENFGGATTSMTAYNPISKTGEYYDGTSDTDENFVDYFISASPSQKNTILLQKFNHTTPNYPTTVSMIENIESVTFKVTSFNLPSSGATKTKYVLNYDIQTIYNYSISGAVVLNNVDDSTNVNFNSVTINTLGTDDYNRTALNIRSTNRELVDRT